jgi:hypothetical protein
MIFRLETIINQINSYKRKIIYYDIPLVGIVMAVIRPAGHAGCPHLDELGIPTR